MAFRRYYFERTVAGSVVPRSGWRCRKVLFGEMVPGAEYAAFCAQPACGAGSSGSWAGRRSCIGGRSSGRRGRARTGIGTATQAHYDLVYLREGHRPGAVRVDPARRLSGRAGRADVPGGQSSPGAAGGGGRHASGRRPRSRPTCLALADEYDARWLVADYAAGDVVIHTAHTIHAALDNVSAVLRLSTDIRYQRGGRPPSTRAGSRTGTTRTGSDRGSCADSDRIPDSSR